MPASLAARQLDWINVDLRIQRRPPESEQRGASACRWKAEKANGIALPPLHGDPAGPVGQHRRLARGPDSRSVCETLRLVVHFRPTRARYSTMPWRNV